MIPIYPLIFYFFAGLTILAALMVVTSKNPVRAILSLVFAFFTTAVLWMLVQAEFLSLLLIFVYVGAVMTLFLFVVMMLKIDATVRHPYIRFMPIVVMMLMAVLVLLAVALYPDFFSPASTIFQSFPSAYNNTQSLGISLFTDHLLAFEVAGLILLVAMLSAIGLAFYGKKPGTQSQKMVDQQSADPKKRLRLVDIKSKKP